MNDIFTGSGLYQSNQSAGPLAHKHPMYLLLILFAFGISGLATLYVKSRMSKYSQFAASSGLTGAETAQHILRANGINDVEVVPATGMMGDHYNPASKVIALSPDIYSGRSTAAVGVAAHECGHAIQHQQAYFPLQLRSAAVGLTQFSSSLLYLPFIFMFMGILAAPHGLHGDGGGFDDHHGVQSHHAAGGV